MQRRDWLKTTAGGAGLAAMSGGSGLTQDKLPEIRRRDRLY